MLSESSPTPVGLWQLFLDSVKDKLSAHVLRTWLRPVHCSAFDGRRVTLEVRDQFFRDWLADHYLDFIRTGLTEVARMPVDVVWLVNPQLADASGDADDDGDGDERGHDDGDGDERGHDDHDGGQDLGRHHEAHADGRGATHVERAEQNADSRAAHAGVGRATSPLEGAQAAAPEPGGGFAAGAQKKRAPRRTAAERHQDAHQDHAPKPTPERSKSSERDEVAAKSARTTQRAASRSAKRPAKQLGQATNPSGAGGADETRQLNKRYVFDSFVQGPSNQFAFAACHAAAQNPGRSYNPLFIYGGVGLGKTHLLSAIGHHILANKKNAKIIYTSSEQFTNEVINAVLSSRLTEFRAKYLNHGDAILVDDIQLIAGKERTQHEFFHIFNTLYDSQRQIVVTSDKLPHEIPDIEERLRNRFQWGLIADVQPPEIETRIAILRKKAEAERFELANDVAFFLARSIRSNVRELEGALVRIMAHASLTGTQVTIDYARATLNDILQNAPSEVSVESIQKTVATYFSIRVSELKGSRRQKALVKARQMAMYLCRKHLGCSYPELGSRFGNKDHTTVLASCSRVIASLGTDVNMRMQLDEIEQRMSFDPH